MPARKSFNPFYVLLLPAGFVFAVTAFAYGFMAFQAVNAVRAEAGAHAGHPMFRWLRAHGDEAMLIELAVLAILTFAAMATDRLWDRSAQKQQEFKHEPPRHEDPKELNAK
jgi:hypothetical protein